MSSAAGGRDGGSATGSGGGGGGGRKHTAGAFDVRNIIAGLIGGYGVVLVIVGLVANGAAERQKTGDVNANLWSGIVMVLVGLAFFLWTRLRPIVVDPGAAVDGDEDGRAQ
jgi:hypothetical protein